eukprot:scaffold7189_cov24-Tisochrysis_lutea.AAC.1
MLENGGELRIDRGDAVFFDSSGQVHQVCAADVSCAALSVDDLSGKTGESLVEAASASLAELGGTAVRRGRLLQDG